MVTPDNMYPDKHERVTDLEKRLAAKRAKVEDLDAWGQSLREEGDASTQRASELWQKMNELETEIERIKAAPADTWEHAQEKLNDMWNDINHQVDELVSRVASKDFGK